MDAIYFGVVMLLIICIMVVLVLRFIAPNESYKPKLRNVVDKLVDKSPELEGKKYDIDDVNDLIGEGQVVDSELYYNFKTLLDAGKLTSTNLLNKVI